MFLQKRINFPKLTLNGVGCPLQFSGKPLLYQVKGWHQWQNRQGEAPIQYSHRGYDHDPQNHHVQGHGKNVAAEFRYSIHVLFKAKQSLTDLCIAVIVRGESVDTTQERHTDTEHQLLRNDCASESRKIAYPQTREIRDTERCGAHQDKAEASLGNCGVDQPLDDERVGKGENAADNDANNVGN